MCEVLKAVKVTGECYVSSRTPFGGYDQDQKGLDEEFVLLTPVDWVRVQATEEPAYVGHKWAIPQEVCRIAPGKHAYVFMLKGGVGEEFAEWLVIHTEGEVSPQRCGEIAAQDFREYLEAKKYQDEIGSQIQHRWPVLANER